jgi:methyl-accepting chemotaxis protein
MDLIQKSSEIQEATSEQKTASEEITQAISAIANGTIEISSGSENLLEESIELNQLAKELESNLGVFKF